MKHFFRLFFLLMTIYSFGQFNTITYPIEQKDKKEYLHQSFSISTCLVVASSRQRTYDIVVELCRIAPCRESLVCTQSRVAAQQIE